MTSTLPLLSYCVLLADASQRDLWLPNIKQVAGDMEVLVWEEGSQPQPADASKSIVLVDDVSVLDGIRVMRFCGIFSGLSQIKSLKTATGPLSYAGYLPAPVMSLYTERNARDGVTEFDFFDFGKITVPSEVIEQARQNAGAVDESRLAMYVEDYRNPPKSVFYFEPSEFQFGAGGGLGAHEWIDITGPPRVLVSGPDIYLPKGNWQMICRFDVDAGAVGMPFTVDWGGDKKFDSVPLIFDRPGVFELAIEHDWTYPMAARLRLVMKNSSLGGIVGFLGGELHPA